MKQLDIASMILNDILDNHTPFPEALRKVFQASIELRPLRGDVAGLIGCELRHDILFTRLLKDKEGLDEKDKRIVSLALANDYYFRHFGIEEVSNAVKGRIGEEKFDMVSSLFVEKDPKADLIPSDVERSSLTYLSLRYNVPEWALKIFQHFGYSNTYKTAKKFARPFVTSLRLEDEELYDAYKQNPDFEETKVPYIFSYKGKTPLRKLSDYKNGKIFEERSGVKFLIDAYKVSDPCEVFLYTGMQKSGFEKELIQSYGNSIGLNIGTKDIDSKVEVTKFIKEKGLSNVNFFDAKDPLSMEASISKQQDLVICCPDSTNFDSVATSPDFFLHFDKDSMDAIFLDEATALEGCSKYVEVGGKLIYVIFTLSKKEGKMTVANFLKNHSDFALLKEEQRFPFDELGCTFYYAVMEKREEETSIPTPLSTLNNPDLTKNPSISFGK